MEFLIKCIAIGCNVDDVTNQNRRFMISNHVSLVNTKKKF